MGGAILIRVVSNDWKAIDYGGVYHAVLQMIRDVIVEIPDDSLLKLRELSIRFERKKKVELIRIMRNDFIRLIVLLMMVVRAVVLVLLNDGNSEWSRFPRASNKEFSDSLEQMQKIARITNGIYLQQSLIKGTIPSGELVSEMFQLGSITPSEVDEIDTTKLGEVVKKIGDLPGQLKETDGVKSIENRLLLLRSIVDSSNGVNKLEKVDDSFSTDITSMTKVDVDWRPVGKYATALNSLVQSIAGVEKNIEITVDNAELMLKAVEDACEELNSELLPTVSSLPKLENVRKAEKMFTTYSTLHTSMVYYANSFEMLKYNMTTDDTNIQLVGDNFKSMGTMVEDAGNSIKDFRTLQHIFGYGSGSRTFKHTPAFSNGASEFKLVSGDFGNAWVQQVIGSEHTQLATALNSLESLAKFGKDVAASNGNSKTISQVFGRITEVSKMKVPFKSLASSLKKVIMSNEVPKYVPGNMDKYKELFDSVLLLFQQLKAIDRMIEVAQVLGTKDSAPHFETVEKISDLKKNDNALTRSSQPTLKSETEGFKEVLNIGDSKGNKKKPLVDPANSILKNKNKLKNYFDDSTKFLKVLNTIRGVKEFESIDPVVQMRKKLSGPTQGNKIDFSSVSKSVDEMKKQMKALKDWIGKMKGFVSVETDALLQLGDVKKDSDTLGSATLGVSNIKKAGGKKIDLSKIDRVIPATKAIKKKKIVKLTADEDKSLKELETLEQDYKSVTLDVSSYIDSVKTSQSNKLVDHVDIFEKASSVDGIQTDFSFTKSGIEKLIDVADSGDQQNLRDFIPVIDQLDSLGLDFSKHHSYFSSAKESLNSMDLTFAKITQLLTPTTTPTPVIKSPSGTQSNPSKPGGPSGAPGNPSQSGSQSASDMENTTKASGGIPWWGMAIIILFVLVLIILFIIWVCRKIPCCRKDKGKVDPELGHVIPPSPDDKGTSTPGNKTPDDPKLKPIAGKSSSVSGSAENVNGSKLEGNSRPSTSDSKTPAGTPSSVSDSAEKVNGSKTSSGSKTPSGGSKPSSVSTSCETTADDKKTSKEKPLVKTSKSKAASDISKSNKSAKSEKNNELETDEPGETESTLPVVPVRIVHAFIRSDFMKLTNIYGKNMEDLANCLPTLKGLQRFELGKKPFETTSNGIEITTFLQIFEIKLSDVVLWTFVEERNIDCEIDPFCQYIRANEGRTILKFHKRDDNYGEFLPLDLDETLRFEEHKLTITCTHIEEKDTDLERRTLKIKFDGETAFDVYFVWHRGNPKYGFSMNPKTMLDLWKEFRATPNLTILSGIYQASAAWILFIELAFRKASSTNEVSELSSDWVTTFLKEVVTDLGVKYPLAFSTDKCKNIWFGMRYFMRVLCEQHKKDPIVKKYIDTYLDPELFSDEPEYSKSTQIRREKGKNGKMFKEARKKRHVSKVSKGTKKNSKNGPLDNDVETQEAVNRSLNFVNDSSGDKRQKTKVKRINERSKDKKKGGKRSAHKK
ncbi:hypothetical protein GCK72_011583 [Caenorhabditis remanei]|uniref:Domain of unknown function WSN domain-containing protein n=1 Tax=Caenorhabditis remanei TaxID=31234 RepID=A0A6A5H800_CAERE|nr:hypothetical protein GCK72_011583 [Caenorhabditis remanei]KAF1763317.1 hypothetical protein GCK72_011583 [Caenorhabditis remanei]